jgi:quinol monooxygenase YgiN
MFKSVLPIRRTFLKYLGAALAATPVLMRPKETVHMYGLIAKITALPGKREELIDLLKGSAYGMPGCLSYVVAEDSADENTVWVTELWDSKASHDASIKLPRVQDAASRAKAIVGRFERIAQTNPVWSAGAPNIGR